MSRTERDIGTSFAGGRQIGRNSRIMHARARICGGAAREPSEQVEGIIPHVFRMCGE